MAQWHYYRLLHCAPLAPRAAAAAALPLAPHAACRVAIVRGHGIAAKKYLVSYFSYRVAPAALAGEFLAV